MYGEQMARVYRPY